MIEEPKESSFYNNPVTRTLFQQSGFNSKDFTKRFLVETLLGSGLNFVASFGQNLGKVQQDKLNLMKENKNLALNELKDIYNSPKNNKDKVFYQAMIDDPVGTKNRLIAEDFKYSQISGIPRGITLADIQNDAKMEEEYIKWEADQNELYEKRFKEFSENDFITSPSLSETKKYQNLISNFSNNYAELKNDPKYAGALPWLIETIKDKVGESAAAEVEMIGEIKASNLEGEVQKQTDFENNLLDTKKIETERKEFARNPVSPSTTVQNVTEKQQDEGTKVAAAFQGELIKRDRENKFSKVKFQVFNQEDFGENYSYEKGGSSDTVPLLNNSSLNKMIVKEFDPNIGDYRVSEQGAASALARTIGVIHSAHYDDMVREDKGVITNDSFAISTVKALAKERRIVSGPNNKLIFYVPNDNDLKREYKSGVNDFERFSHVVSFANSRKKLKTIDEVFEEDNILQLQEFQRRKADTRVGFDEIEKLNVEIDKRRNINNQEKELLKLDLLINTPQYLKGKEIKLSEDKTIILGNLSKTNAQLLINKYETKEFEGGKVKAPEYLRNIVDNLPTPTPNEGDDGKGDDGGDAVEEMQRSFVGENVGGLFRGRPETTTVEREQPTPTGLMDRSVGLLDRKVPRGIRNKNPMNLYIGDVRNNKFVPNTNVAKYNGIIDVDYAGIGTQQTEAYPIFETEELGLRAGVQNFVKKYNNKSIAEIGKQYSRTDRDSYANNVASLSGLDVNEKINFNKNPDALVAAIKGVIILENGLYTENSQRNFLPSSEEILEAFNSSKKSLPDSEYSQTTWLEDINKIKEYVSSL